MGGYVVERGKCCDMFPGDGACRVGNNDAELWREREIEGLNHKNIVAFGFFNRCETGKRGYRVKF